MNDAGIARLLAELDEPTGHKDCERDGCEYPAVLGGPCGLHRGKELRSYTVPRPTDDRKERKT